MSVTTHKTPGVYIQELDAFGNAVVPVPTAIPAFIGFTGQTSYNGKSLVGKPVKISSLADFYAIFGSTPPQIQFNITAISAGSVTKAADAPATDSDTTKTADAAKNAKPDKAAGADKTGGSTTNGDNTKPATGGAATPAVPDFVIGTQGYQIALSTIHYRLFNAIQFFYENGGGTCYIVSTGGYDFTQTALSTTTPFTDALTTLAKETEPTMIVIPEAVEFSTSGATDIQSQYSNCYSLQQAMINHCGALGSRVALLDIPGGYSEPAVGTTPVEAFRNVVEPTIPKYYSYAAAYYPWVHTTVNQLTDVGYQNLASGAKSAMASILNAEFPTVNNVANPMAPYINALFPATTATTGGTAPAKSATGAVTTPSITPDKAESVLKNLSQNYKMIMNLLLDKLNLMPPSAAVAGIYTVVDNQEGVWKAPANVGIQSVVSPAVKIDAQAQEDLNVPVTGKSICAIRAFTGKGVLVWGARTLDGNSNDWRYVNVRRTLIYIEQSVKEAASAYVFAPNDANTWVNVKSMISNFLLGVWNQGGLVGPKPADAFSVNVGLGITMTPEDILNGVMNVSVLVAVSHPAEFIEITFQQEMQKG